MGNGYDLDKSALDVKFYFRATKLWSTVCTKITRPGTCKTCYGGGQFVKHILG